MHNLFEYMANRDSDVNLCTWCWSWRFLCSRGGFFEAVTVAIWSCCCISNLLGCTLSIYRLFVHFFHGALELNSFFAEIMRFIEAGTRLFCGVK